MDTREHALKEDAEFGRHLRIDKRLLEVGTLLRPVGQPTLPLRLHRADGAGEGEQRLALWIGAAGTPCRRK